MTNAFQVNEGGCPQGVKTRADLLARVKELESSIQRVIENAAKDSRDMLAQLHQRDTALNAAREALEHCLEASSDPPKYGRYLSKEDRE